MSRRCRCVKITRQPIFWAVCRRIPTVSIVPVKSWTGLQYQRYIHGLPRKRLMYRWLAGTIAMRSLHIRSKQVQRNHAAMRPKPSPQVSNGYQLPMMHTILEYLLLRVRATATFYNKSSHAVRSWRTAPSASQAFLRQWIGTLREAHRKLPRGSCPLADIQTS